MELLVIPKSKILYLQHTCTLTVGIYLVFLIITAKLGHAKYKPKKVNEI